ncbi:hypothetical protein AURDEDRAFT_177466 [Auricularia subglabra TFB-10046 SS5]|uniref:Uncharacterized protein n=1 Tax=Auricularia subglabra (strain TFB-10046 / SS5) TaxID=717982 RepID=J0WNP8_AURST|nr:hypothetical protein AURDEDRAFT_177466 [Auricularia subglabra TFB-10046 SS5]
MLMTFAEWDENGRGALAGAARASELAQSALLFADPLGVGTVFGTRMQRCSPSALIDISRDRRAAASAWDSIAAVRSQVLLVPSPTIVLLASE